MWCTSCAHAVESKLARHQGVQNVAVDYITASAHIAWDPNVCTLDDLAERVENLGYRLTEPRNLLDEVYSDSAKQRNQQLARLAVGAFFAMWSMLPALALYLDTSGELTRGQAWRLALVSGLASIPVLSFSGLPFLRAGWRTLRAGVPGMDTLVSLGMLSAFGFSTWQLAAGSSRVYFDTASMLVVLLLVGRTIEQAVRRKAFITLKEMLASAPDSASLVRDDGREVPTPVSELNPGDHIRVRPGESVPIDGVVQSGTSSVDASLLTGESAPRQVRTGDEVLAGMVNGSSEIRLRVTVRDGERRLDRIAATMRHLMASRPHLEGVANRWARILVPTAITLALLTGSVAALLHGELAFGLERAFTVLIITCPCALGLATPMALLAAVANAASRGVMITDAQALEKLARVDCVFFDKTGTLTVGSPRVSALRPAAGKTSAELIGAAAMAEDGSEHALGAAIRDHHGCCAPSTGHTSAVPGRGVSWVGDGEKILVGRGEFVGAPASVPRDSPGTTAHVARNGQYLGAIEFEDSARPEARDELDQLRARGYDLAVLSGDHQRAVARLTEALGFAPERVFAEQVPEQKAEVLDRERREGRRIAYVGDGLNDGPALLAADVGIAMPRAVGSSMAVASVVLQTGGLEQIPALLILGKRTFRIMKQNLAWAVLYNVAAIGLAMWGLVAPWMAAVAMTASSLTVTLNAARLRAPRIDSPT
jgi:heavy metal translocating P-type ATPase